MRLNPQYRQTSIRALCICALLFSGIPLLPSPLLSADNNGFTVIVETVSDNKLTITYELRNYSITESIKNGNTFSRIMLSGAERTNVAGKPNLPFVSTLFGIPVSGDFDVALQSIKTIKKTIPFVEPVDPIALGPVLAGRFNLDGFYKQDTYYPASHFEMASPGFFRDHRIGAILFFPFRYNPQTRTLSIITQATFIISFASQAREPGNIRIPEKDNKAEFLFSNLVSNYEQCKRWLKPHPFPQVPGPRQADTLFKIITGEEGLHHITYTDLINAGIDPSTINAREIHITHRGFEIPIYVKGEEDSVFNMQDYIDFFALSIHGETTFFNPYTFKNVYWLSFGDSLGKRMVEEDGTPDSISHFRLSSFRDTIHFEKDSIFVRLSVITADSTDMWFWDRLYGPDTQYIEVFVPSPDTLAPFNLMINLHGFTTTHAGHRVQVLFNDSFLGNASWHGQAPYTLSIEGISGNILHHGSNTLTLILPAPVDSVDGLFSNWVEISYDHLLRSSNNTITFNIPEDMQDTTYEFIIDNFDFADVEIFKPNVSKIINFQREAYQEQGNTKYRFIFQDNDITSLMRFTILPIWEKYQPEHIEKVHLRDLHATTHNAEFLIITSDALITSAETYALWKETHGFDCMVVTTDEIYNEFNHGIDSPEAIKQFICYAYDYYNQPPLYCLLFGDGTFDYRGIGGHNGNLVPVHLSMYWGLWGAVADDGYFARVSGDDLLPDIFIGRFPIRSDDEFDGIFEKAKMYVDYQNLDEWKRKLVFVADSGTAGYNSFSDMERIIADYLPPAYDANRCYHPRKMREDFLKEMDEGAVFVNFLSHGGGDILCGGGFLISKDVFRMTNLDRMPFWTAFSCVNGFFDEPHPDSISIGETVFLAPNGGGIGYYGPGSLTYGGHNYSLSRRIYEGFFNHNLLHFGQFLTYGEIAYYSSYGNRYQLYTYNLLGDPGIELSLPDTTHIDLSISVSSISAGDTVTVQGVLLSSLQGEAVVTYYTVRDTALVPFQKISVPVVSGTFTAAAAVPDTVSGGKGIVKVYFRGMNIDGIGYEYFSIEQPNISLVTTIPLHPTRDDSVQVQARIYDPDSIAQALLNWHKEGISGWTEIPMVPLSADTFITVTSIPPQLPNTTIEYRIHAQDSLGNTDTSRIYSYHITARSELSFVSKTIYLSGDTLVTINVAINNTGETAADSFRVGFFTLNTEKSFSVSDEPGTISRVLNPDTIGFDTLSLGIDSVKTATVSFGMPFERYNVYAVIDPDNWTEEEDESNNSSVDSVTNLWVDHFLVTPDSGSGGSMQSSDSILYCIFAPNSVSSKAVAVLKPDSMKKPLLEPDISPFPILGETTRAYSIKLAKDVLVDSFLVRFALRDSVASNPWIYLWLDDYKKWATMGETEQDSIFFEKNARHLGLFSLFFNRDSVPPSITSRIENTNLRNEVVYEKNVWVSSILTDKNGIDVITRNVCLVLNGDTVESDLYTYSKNPSDSRSIPLKYSAELEDGSYMLILSAYDVNGNQGFDTLMFTVSIPFDMHGIGNYPNPVYLDSTIFTYHLTRDADELSLKLFTSGGKLIKEFIESNVNEGYHEIVWDLKDKKNNPVANGVYFYRFIARRRDEEIIRTFKMAVLR